MRLWATFAPLCATARSWVRRNAQHRWNDDGEGIFDENWFGVLFGAAAGWQPGESSEDVFTASYGLAFHGDATGKVVKPNRS